MATKTRVGIVSGLETLTKSLVIVSVVVGLGMVAIAGLGGRIAASLITGTNPAQDWQVTIGGSGWNDNLPTGITSLKIGTKPGYTDDFDRIAGTMDAPLPPLAPSFSTPDVYINRPDWLNGLSPRNMGDVRAPLVAGVDKTWNIRVVLPPDYPTDCSGLSMINPDNSSANIFSTLKNSFIKEAKAIGTEDIPTTVELDATFEWGNLSGLPSNISLTLKDYAYSPAVEVNMKTTPSYTFCPGTFYAGNRFQITARLATSTVAAPIFSPPPGTYTSAQTVSLSTATTLPGTRILYHPTITPSCNPLTGAIYVRPFVLSRTTTMKAIACLGSGSTAVGSDVVTGAYTINPAPTYDWSGILTASFGLYSRQATFGTASNATDGFDRTLDGVNPPPAPDGVDFYFYNTSVSDILLRNLLTDIRSTISAGSSKIWDLELLPGTDTSTNGTINWDRSRFNTFTDYTFTFTDRAVAGRTFNLKTATPPYPFNPQLRPASGKRFQITVARAAAVVAPTFSPVSGSYPPGQRVTLSAPAGTIYYTIDGSEPTCSSTRYVSSIGITRTMTIKAVACVGSNRSAPVSGTYSLISVADPTFSPAPGTYGSAQTVSLSTTTPGARIVYHPTITPSCNPITGAIYVRPFVLSRTTTMKAIACLGSGSTAVGSNVVTGAYNIVATPTFSPPPGTYGSAQTVSLSTTTTLPGTRILYHPTITPSCNPLTGAIYVRPFVLSRTTTMKAITCVGSGSTAVGSNVVTGAYNIVISTPTLSPSPGTYLDRQNLTISSTVTGATIRYNIGEFSAIDPTCSTGSVYSNPISLIDGSYIVKAIVCSGSAPSAVVAGQYYINP